MASLYKKPVLARDPSTGEMIKTKSKKWWGQYKDARGTLRRVPLAMDKVAAQAMLNALVRGMERQKAGLSDPTDEQRKRPLVDHVAEFERYLNHKGITAKQVHETKYMLRRLVDDERWKFITDITAGAVLEFMSQLREEGLSAQTCNHHLKAAKQFTRWLVREHRMPQDPLVHISRLNVLTDRRHDRRPLSADEFSLLVETARTSQHTIESIPGPDRAMMYILAAWTGFRKGEIGSLTLSSLRLDDDPPTATVAACYSKRRRKDVQILHPELVRQLREWLDGKGKLKEDEPLFPVSGRVPQGTDRKAHKLVAMDLAAARKKWIEESDTADERRTREESDFLCYRSREGLFADFHSMRHLFITSLERAGISPKMAQTLARHSDIQLTLGVYTHVELQDQTAAIESLPAPPGGNGQPAGRLSERSVA